jgi:hypothetical protein
MSLLDDDRPTNPAKHFINAKNGALSYYDKESSEDVAVPTPFGFIVLDQCSTVKGWSAEEDTGYWSNEVKAVGKEPFNVRTKNGLKATGLWKEIKDELKADGAVFHSVIYVAAKGRDGLETQALLLKGAALNAWVEFTKKNNVKTNKVTLSEWSDAKKGAVKYKVPVFTAEPMEDAEKDEALELAKELRTYHNGYFSSKSEETREDAPERKEDVVIEDISDEPVNLDDIPF